VDHMCHSPNFVAAGIGQWLHDGWSHSHPPGHRHRCGTGPSYSGTKMIVRIWTLAEEGEVFGKEVVNRPARFYRIYDTFIKKISQTTISLPTYKEE
jgi:hypothetical protein